MIEPKALTEQELEVIVVDAHSTRSLKVAHGQQAYTHITSLYEQQVPKLLHHIAHLEQQKFVEPFRAVWLLNQHEHFEDPVDAVELMADIFRAMKFEHGWECREEVPPILHLVDDLYGAYDNNVMRAETALFEMFIHLGFEKREEEIPCPPQQRWHRE